VEINNTRNAHIKDGVAVTKFMYYLYKTFSKRDNNPSDETEISLANKLHEFRLTQEGFLGESFDTISAWGEHGAIVHYEPTQKTDIAITEDNFLLVDSGGHYLEGTTDITRTFLIGKASSKMVRDYTLVLKSNINLARAKFIKGTSGKSLDMLARNVLWQEGLDFLHGTGHGVGHILSVHEGPNNISIRSPYDIHIVSKMITTDEPGLYFEGEYGIRLENELLCIEDESNEYGDFLKFECLTFVPFDINCIDVSMLNEEERRYLNGYHAFVYDKISPYLDEEETAWLKEVTSEI
jgi:Xaa-Pro aminopeptidase